MNVRESDIIPGGIYPVPSPFAGLAGGESLLALALESPDSKGYLRFACVSSTLPTEGETALSLTPEDFMGEPLPLPCYLPLAEIFRLPAHHAGKIHARVNTQTIAAVFRSLIVQEIPKFFAASHPPGRFVPSHSPVPISGKVYGYEEMQNLVEASLDFWLTTGRFADQFEAELAHFLGRKHTSLVNSGSSANLLALTCLTSPKLGSRRLFPGDEVITVATGFPTTVNPIIQNGLIPVFVDISIPTYNIDIEKLEMAFSPRTRAVMLAHTLGNPFDLSAVSEFVKSHDLWLIEDNCDALGSTFNGKFTGTFGHLSTLSFYPAHHITMGEGGAVLADSAQLKILVESFRDWGRDCYCKTGHDNTCKKRFDWQLGSLPKGFDHKYTYSHIGYNLKATDLQAAVGLAQLKRLPKFIEARRHNFSLLYDGLKDLQDFFILPEATAGSDPSWFGFPLIIRDGASFHRTEIIDFLESRKIATRLFFGGNLLRQPAYSDVPHRIVGDLRNSDYVMEAAFWIGLYPGLVRPMIDFVIEAFHEFVKH